MITRVENACSIHCDHCQRQLSINNVNIFLSQEFAHCICDVKGWKRIMDSPFYGNVHLCPECLSLPWGEVLPTLPTAPQVVRSPLAEYAVKVKKMRDKQRLSLKTNSSRVLEDCSRLEQEIDEITSNILNHQ